MICSHDGGESGSKEGLLSNGRSERLSRFVGGKKVGVVAMKSALAFWASVACDRPAA